MNKTCFFLGQFRCALGINADELATAALILEFYEALDQREQRVVLAAADNRRLKGRSADLCFPAFARYESFDVDLIALFAFDRRHADRLALVHRKLFSARSNNCVTHLLSPINRQKSSCQSKSTDYT